MRPLMKNILLLLFTFISLTSTAQIEVIDSNIVVEVVPDIIEFKENVHIVNTANSTLEFYWDIDRGNAPPEWDFKICDLNLCYFWGVETCPCSQTNFFQPGDTSKIQVYMRPNGVEGVADISVRILEICGSDSTYNSFPVSYVVSNSVSTSFEEIKDNLVLYPNPSSNFFKVKNDETITDVMVYNIIGKKIFEERHRAGQSHDVSRLNKGLYLVRLLDKSNNIVKVLRLNKD